MMLSQNYSLEEFISTQHRGVNNTPPDNLLPNLRRTAGEAEEISKILGCRLIITSGYRSPSLNEIVGGSRTSRHSMGLAIDFIAPDFGDPLKVCKRLMETDLDFDQLIYEHTWVHYGLAPEGLDPRKSVLTYMGKNSYVKGLVTKQ